MANVKYGVIVTELKGSVGGMTFQGGRSGGMLRSKPRGLNLKMKEAKEPRQTLLNTLAFLSRNWGKRTVAQRDSWANLLGVWTFTDKFGDVYNGTAYQIYISFNTNRMNNGLTPLASAPAEITGQTITINRIDMSVSASMQVVVNDPSVYDSYFQIRVSRNVTAGKTGKRIQYVKMVNHFVTGANSISFKNEYEKTFGSLPEIGSFVWVWTQQYVAGYPRYYNSTFTRVEVTA